MLVLNQRCNLHNERGAALLLTMMLMIVFSLLTVSLYDFLQASTQITGNHRQDLQAIYVADAGAEDAINQLRIDPTLADSGVYTFPVPPDPPVDFAGGTYSFTITDVTLTNPTFFREKDIVSTGVFRDITRVLEVHVGILETFDSKGNPIYSVATSSWRIIAPTSP